MNLKSISYIFLMLVPYILFGQNPQYTLNYQQLKDSISKYDYQGLFIDSYLQKAKREKDTFHIAYGFLYKSYTKENVNAIKYCDSIINLTKKIDNYEFPALGFMLKGYFLYENGQDDLALKEYLKAFDYALKKNNISQQIEIRQFIGGVKYNYGDFKNSIPIFKEQLKFLKNQNNLEKYIDDYLIALDDLSKSYLTGKMPDSALIYIKNGIKLSLKYQDEDMYSRFMANSASANYKLNHFEQAIDSINKIEPFIKDDVLAMCYYFKAKIYEKQNSKFNIHYLNKIDSIYQSTKYVYPELRDVYNSIYKYHTENSSEREQLKSIKKLIHIESVINANNKNFDNQILKEYEIPKLKNEKKYLERQLLDNHKKSNKYLALFSIILLITILIIVKFYQTQKLYKKRYLSIINNQTEKVLLKEKPISGENKKELNISKLVIEKVLHELDLFEQNNGFLENGLTLNSFSKSIGTNSSYLSKIINHHKSKNFSNYLNSLRINYVTEKLKKDIKFRNYTIAAIAEDVGFNNSESFSKSFYKELGIYPSYFIKQLKKNS